MLHFVNGSVVARGLREAGVEGAIVEAADLLHEGPCPPGCYGEAWVTARARYLAGRGYTSETKARKMLGHCSAAVATASGAAEIVLWYEHDLFDQLLLVWLIDALATAGVSDSRITLIVLGDHPDLEAFDGLGQLSPRQLADLLPTRTPLTAAQRAAGREAWAAVCHSSPPGVQEIAVASRHPLPWLPGALTRLLEEYPGAGDGLSRTERQALTAIGDGAVTLDQAFRESSAREERRFLGDLPFAAAVNGLSEGPAPLVRLGGGERLSLSRTATLTDAGAAVLEGGADHATLNGLDRWIGGVHLRGDTPAWRWDRRARRLTSASH